MAEGGEGEGRDRVPGSTGKQTWWRTTSLVQLARSDGQDAPINGLSNATVRSSTYVALFQNRTMTKCEWVSDMSLPRLPNEIIDSAILGFEEQKRRLDRQIAELRVMRSGATHTAPVSVPSRRKMSAAGRKAIAAAQRKRWAALKGGNATQRAHKRAKRKLSPAGRAAIVAALKKRWAAKKAAKKD